MLAYSKVVPRLVLEYLDAVRIARQQVQTQDPTSGSDIIVVVASLGWSLDWLESRQQFTLPLASLGGLETCCE